MPVFPTIIVGPHTAEDRLALQKKRNPGADVEIGGSGKRVSLRF
jgi:hypothetical protein